MRFSAGFNLGFQKELEGGYTLGMRLGIGRFRLHDLSSRDDPSWGEMIPDDIAYEISDPDRPLPHLAKRYRLK